MEVEIVHDLHAKAAIGKHEAHWWLSNKRTGWELTAPFEVIIDGRRIIVPTGYVFDGSSVPRALWWLYPPGFLPAWRGSCVHDRLYSHGYREFDKPFADKALKAFMQLDGASRLEQRLFYFATSKFGKGGWSKTN